MLIRFMATDKRKVYHGNISLMDGETAKVSDAEGQRLLRDFPDNFEAVVDKPPKIEEEQPEAKALKPKRNKLLKGERNK